ncbi:DNA topoisomerase [Dichotomopilus funicola]|uniref:DNA topoisomerase 2 n=1 Tax=Dichotomopilus funicola TaxID=1934379 RepID=A0AAN6V268_9PEZI|nr:DNA topoisomerase [Dichotomopilus funicola]
MDSDGDSVFGYEDESDAYSPEVKPKAKPAPKKPTTAKPKAAPTTAKATKGATKKRAKSESDAEDSVPKKQKKAPTKKASKPLAEIENDSMVVEEDGDGDAPAAGPTAKSDKTATEMYQKLTQLEHIIKRPDTYIGSVERLDQKMWVYNTSEKLMENRNVAYVPGLYKIFDEILVNAADNSQRDSSMTYLKVTVDRATGEISVENNGKGIPVEIHGKEKCYIPELIFGHLLTGSNYDDNEKKTVGGRNGYGAKLTNIFSQKFSIELQDSVNCKRYKQTWSNNMSVMEKPKILTNKSSDFVKVSFLPDYKRFGMENGIDDDLEGLIYRRVYDLAGTVSGIKVWLNGEHLKINFKSYCELYAKAIANERGDLAVDGQRPAAKVEFDQQRHNGRLWQVGFTVSDGSFQQVSFVNNIATTSGGTHVNYIADQICEALGKEMNKKKKGHSLKASHFRNHIFIFINCLIDNPAFNSQTKEQLTTKMSAFGSKCVLSDAFLKKVKASEAIQNIMDFADKKADKLLAKSDGNKRSRISNDKLIDANWAGSKRGHECTLILTEGDSARGLAVAGRAVLDPDRIGVFPLRGKMLNVRDASLDQIMKNKEIENIKKILGLKHKQDYRDTKGLRYGHLMIMADQDLDGSHIKGLLINFLEVQFPSLLRVEDFFQEFITPVVKVWQGNNPKKPQNLKTFFNLPQYETWKDNHKSEIRKWKYKYLKGLGSSSNEDAQIYFKDLDRHLKKFEILKPEESQLFELAFSKKKADARKEWLGNFVPGTYMDVTAHRKSYTDFVHKELILFSMADNMRSIPSMIDGLKPGQRKVIYAAFKRNLVNDQKVAELAGYISEVAAYHHGEMSLQQTIVGLAQTYVGSNNVNCLEPSGNFGSRLSGGSDAASARYIHTRLSPFARRVFSKLDEPSLEYQDDDGKEIEPKVYVPVIPMVLVNGADGIGTGWSTQIPNYHPVHIVENLKRRMGRFDPEDTEEKPFQPMTPWFRGWKGVVEPDGPNRFKFNGIIKQDEQKPNEIHVTELPIRMWTDDFKSKLEDIIRGEKVSSFIKDYREFNDHQTVHFIIDMEDKHMKAALEEGLIEKFKLTKSVTTTNLVAFNTRGQIQKYENTEQIMEEFYNYRLKMYSARKKHWLGVYHADYRKLKNQYRFILEIVEEKLVVNRKRKAVLVQELRDRKYEAFPPKDDKKKSDEELNNEGEEEETASGARDYDYLLSMAIWSLTTERLEKLKNQIAAKKAEYDELDALSEKDLWIKDLDGFLEEWHTQLKLEEEITTGIRRMGRRASAKIGAGKGRRIKDDDDYQPEKKTKGKAVKAEKVETKTHQRFTEKFQAASKPKPKADLSDDDDFAFLGKKAMVKTEVDDAPAPAAAAATGRNKRAAATKSKYVLSDDSDDDFMELGKADVKDESEDPPEEVIPKPTKRAAAKAKPSYADEDDESDAEEVAAKPTKRAAAKAKRSYIDDEFGSDSDEDNGDDLLGDVGAMVKGIGAPATNSGRLSLFAMSRPEAGDAPLPRVKSRQSRSVLEVDDHDDTNYEALAMSSPRKSTTTKSDDIDDFLSDDDLPAPPKATAKPAASSKAKAPLSVVPGAAKKRGRPAGAKNKPKDDAAAAAPAPKAKGKTAVSLAKSKTAALSPAAKAYAAKKAKSSRKVLDDDDDNDELMEDAPASPPPSKPLARRPGRAAAAKAKPIVDEDEDDSFVSADSGGEGARAKGKSKKRVDSDAFDMDEDSD